MMANARRQATSLRCPDPTQRFVGELVLAHSPNAPRGQSALEMLTRAAKKAALGPQGARMALAYTAERTSWPKRANALASAARKCAPPPHGASVSRPQIAIRSGACASTWLAAASAAGARRRCAPQPPQLSSHKGLPCTLRASSAHSAASDSQVEMSVGLHSSSTRRTKWPITADAAYHEVQTSMLARPAVSSYVVQAKAFMQSTGGF
jgi:hypothetical protein